MRQRFATMARAGQSFAAFRISPRMTALPVPAVGDPLLQLMFARVRELLSDSAAKMRHTERLMHESERIRLNYHQLQTELQDVLPGRSRGESPSGAEPRRS